MQPLSTASRHPLRPSRAGFSLAELMVVIVILGLLATLVVPNVMGALFKANDVVAKTDISQICQAIDNYSINNRGRSPETLQDLEAPDANGESYIKKLPKDPWGNEYVYFPPQGGRPYQVISYGADGVPGGEGKDADITNETIRERK